MFLKFSASPALEPFTLPGILVSNRCLVTCQRRFRKLFDFFQQLKKIFEILIRFLCDHFESLTRFQILNGILQKRWRILRHQLGFPSVTRAHNHQPGIISLTGITLRQLPVRFPGVSFFGMLPDSCAIAGVISVHHHRQLAKYHSASHWFVETILGYIYLFIYLFVWWCYWKKSLGELVRVHYTTMKWTKIIL